MNREHATFPEPAAGPRGQAAAARAMPSGGPNLGAIDYRANPSAGQIDHPNGVPVGPMPDLRIAGYDLPSEPGSYDRMSERG